jgi:hypothetical protein
MVIEEVVVVVVVVVVVLLTHASQNAAVAVPPGWTLVSSAPLLQSGVSNLSQTYSLLMHCKLPVHNHWAAVHNAVVVVIETVVVVTVGGAGAMCAHTDVGSSAFWSVTFALVLFNPSASFGCGAKATPIAHSASDSRAAHGELAGKSVYKTGLFLELTRSACMTILTFKRPSLMSTPLVGNTNVEVMVVVLLAVVVLVLVLVTVVVLLVAVVLLRVVVVVDDVVRVVDVAVVLVAVTVRVVIVVVVTLVVVVEQVPHITGHVCLTQIPNESTRSQSCGLASEPQLTGSCTLSHN